MCDLEYLSFKPDETGSSFNFLESRIISQSQHSTNGNAGSPKGKVINISVQNRSGFMIFHHFESPFIQVLHAKHMEVLYICGF